MGLTDKQKAEYFHRSYAVTDGLWFVKAEDRYGFDAALQLDDDVWKVAPKIQARMLKEMLGLEQGMDGLYEALKTKFDLEQVSVSMNRDKENDTITVTVTNCPWHNMMVKSQRKHLSGHVHSTICVTEQSGWANEFGDNIHFKLKEQICCDAIECSMEFSRSK